jgi:N-acyl-D-aspartate/D-glutamate deacylase
MLDLCLESDLDARFGSMTGNRSDRMLLEELFPYDGVRLGGSDAGAHQGMLCDARYPGFMLGHWVRERDFPLERAIRMMTTMEGECYGINDRGSLTPGLAADVVVFDPDTISDGQLRRVNDLPADGRRLIAEPTGIDYVVVNGTVIREHGVDAVDSEGPLPGTLLREFASHRERVGPLGAPLPQGTKTPTRT